MKHLSLFLIFPIFSLSVNFLYSQTNAELIGNNIAVFYPENFEASSTLPSMALLSEPDSIGPLPANWPVIPEFIIESGKNKAIIETEDNIDLYGTGEVVGSLRRNNTEVILWNTDNYGYWTDDGKRLYQSHPWILAVRDNGTSYGILIDHTWKQTIKLNNPIEIISEGPPFRIIIIERDTPQEVMMVLAELTGKPELPPLWALGYHQCRYSYYPDTEVLELADTFREKEIPCDVIWMDIDYMDGYRVFTFDPVGFPDPQYVNSYLHEKGFHSIWMIDPGVKYEEGYYVYDEGTTGDYWVKTSSGNTYYGDVWPGTCAFPDFTMPETRSWWSGLYPPFMAYGIDGVWNDMNEPAVFNEDKTMPQDNIHRGGGELPEDIHLRYHNVYGMLMVKATREGIKVANPDKRPFVLTRANFLGGHRYAATWTGDNQSSWEHMKMSIPMSLNLGLSGTAFNGPDIGGFAGSPGAELLGQWMAIGAFYPFCRNHTSTDTHQQEPWSYGTETEQVSRIALQRRYMLLPYLYTLFYENSITGMPVMQPVFFSDPDDLSLRSEEEAFMLGDKLLVIPSWAGNTNLPDGHWREIFLIDPEIENDGYQPRLKQKPGSVIPCSDIIQNTNEYSDDHITLLIAPDEEFSATGQLYADAGNGYEYFEGGYLLTELTVEPTYDDSLLVSCLTAEGELSSPNRAYRAGLVTSCGINYFDWTSDSVFKIPLLPDLYAKITSPADGSEFEVGETVELQVELTGNLDISKLTWYSNGNIIAEITEEPYDFTWENADAGIHFINAIAENDEGLSISSDEISIKVGQFGSGEITYQVWQNIGGGILVSDLTSNSRYPDDPDDNSTLNEFFTPENTGDEFGARIIGYLHPPYTGFYHFNITGDDYCELWLSSDSLPDNRQLIAEVPGWTYPGEWNKYEQQTSEEIYLETGNKYFIMGLQKEAYNDDHLAVAWDFNGNQRTIIDGDYLSPWKIQSGIHQNNLLKLLVYPNPARNEFFVNTRGHAGTISLSGITGKIIYSKQTGPYDEIIRINTKEYETGIYSISFQSENMILVEKLVIYK